MEIEAADFAFGCNKGNYNLDCKGTEDVEGNNMAAEDPTKYETEVEDKNKREEHNPRECHSSLNYWCNNFDKARTVGKFVRDRPQKHGHDFLLNKVSSTQSNHT